MIERSERAMSESERETVRIFSGGWGRSSMPILTAAGAAILGVATLFMWSVVFRGHGRAVSAGLRWAVIGSILTGGLVAKLWWDLRRRVGYGRDLDDGVAEVNVYTVEGEVAKVVVSATQDSAGPLWLVDVGESRVLVLRGDYLKPLEDDGTFPCTRFEIVRAKASGLELSTRPLGDKLPVGRIASVPLALARDGELRMGTIGAVLDSLGATV